MSSFNVLGDPMPAMGRWHHEREQAVRASGIPATFLRPGGFMTNALDWLPAIRDGGYVLDPAGPGRYAPIDPADIAAVAALALTSDGHQGREYVLTGGPGAHRRRTGPDPLSDDRPRHQGPRARHTRRSRPRPLPQRSTPGTGRGLPRSDRPHARRHHRAAHRHRPAPARPQAPHLRRLVRTQHQSLPAGRNRDFRQAVTAT